ncbi:alginate lyase family protein [Pseudomonas sp. C32]|uniref:alginate lyase family protein n=1 Tax=Pseudomonas sp. C32 TaxID=1529208 RepID=UPI0026036AF8|nr:alginate lyase family protein [Pseudomonas sp. C32]MDN4544648.1 alginate lyase family protein [Pseudomonas sp. C32]
MSLRCLPLLLLAALLPVTQPSNATAGGTRSIWSLPTSVTAPSVLPDYHSLVCPKPVIEPFTGALLVDSKYDQSDPTKSTLGKGQSQESQRIHDSVASYGKMLSLFADYYAKAQDPPHAAMALACMDQWLEAWAAAGALENREANKTGIAVRNWALAAIASSVLKLQALSGNQLRLSERQKQWLDRLAGIIIEEYDPRLAPSFGYFNNHDYWAAWSIGSTGMLLGKQSRIDWSAKVFRRAMQQITPSVGGDYAYLPNELARGTLAANYTHYALVPLTLVAETLRLNGASVTAEDSRKLDLLANFAARIVLAPNGLPELQGQKQQKVPPYKMAWLVPFLSHNPQHVLARQLYGAEHGDVDGYRQIGGHIKPFYPNVE